MNFLDGHFSELMKLYWSGVLFGPFYPVTGFIGQFVYNPKYGGQVLLV